MNGAPLQQKVVISNPQGFHMRPMAAFAQLAARFQSSVKVSREGQSVNGKSILDLMLLAAAQGTELTLEVAGPDVAGRPRSLGQCAEDADGGRFTGTAPIP